MSITPEPPSVSRMLVEPFTLLDVIPVAGPPAILIVGPLVLLGLMVAGPFVLVLTLVVALIAATMLAALAAAVIASPYLLVRRIHGRRRARRGSFGVPRPRLVRVHARRAAA